MVAIEDIRVIKLLNNERMSLFSPNNKVYTKDQLYKTTMKESPDDRCCFDNECEEWLNKEFYGWREGHPDLKYIGQGFHSMSLDRYKRSGHDFKEIPFDAIIPKGAKYFTDPTGLYVSNQIIVK